MQVDQKNDIIHTSEINKEIITFLDNYKDEYILVLTDDNTFKFCLPIIQDNFDKNAFYFSIKPGEKNKNLPTLNKIWKFLADHHFSKKSLLVNLGGGVVTDIGGFAASTFKRGLDFVNIPTTLLAQVDASSGGKNGINYQQIKNNIGTINLPNKVFLSSVFLKTLKKREFLSGFAEMIKHALIDEKKTYDDLIGYINTDSSDLKLLQTHIKKSVEIKARYTEIDLFEKGPRKILNFGHTFGHAFESWSLSSKHSPKHLKHGEAVAYGIICELYLSVKKMHFPEPIFFDIVNQFKLLFGKFSIPEFEFRQIFEIIQSDKKNSNSSVLCILLKNIGYPVYGISITGNEIFETLEVLNSEFC